MIPITNEIKSFLHCALCIEERPDGVSPRDWARLEIGWTPQGIQLWCKRHEMNVMHMDFEGQQHPANTAPWSTNGEDEQNSSTGSR